MKHPSSLFSALLTLFFLLGATSLPAGITHGPALGRPGSDTMSVWARTSESGTFHVTYGLGPQALDQTSEIAQTQLDHDNTGVVTLQGLTPAMRYYYRVVTPDGHQSEVGTFRTWPSAEWARNAEYNPKGLFNYKFEFACGNNPKPESSAGHPMATYQTLFDRKVADEVDFAILNGDWLYEEKRDYPVESWIRQMRIDDADVPGFVRQCPSVTGLWENYKTFWDRSPNLRDWHRRVPTFYTIDDHEIINDVFGTNTPGYRNRRPVFRDIAVRGWIDYLAWSNPQRHEVPAYFGKARLRAGIDLLEDFEADFTKMPWKDMANLHVHWGGQLAGVMDPEQPIESADPNFGVYRIEEVIDANTLRLDRPLPTTSVSSYSIGRRAYGSFEIANTEFFILDTRSHRDLHDIDNPSREDLSILGRQQMDWLLDGLTNSEAEFLFIVSSVNFMVPHIGSGGGVDKVDDIKKDDAWTVFLHDREKLIEHADSLGKQVFVLTGDLHNSFAIKITDRVWEFASGPHNSINHSPPLDEGNRPANGPFLYGPRPCEIKWSTYAMPDIPRLSRRFPQYCIVSVNNVFNQPRNLGAENRWVAWERPYVMFQFYNGLTGELNYVETIHAAEQVMKGLPVE